MHSSMHAEMNIVVQILKKLKIWKIKSIIASPLKKIKGTLYIARTNGCRLSNCKPCSECNRYLENSGIATIKYTDFINGEEVLVTMKKQ